jgi:hypothetical protein
MTWLREFANACIGALAFIAASVGPAGLVILLMSKSRP